ncbi:uncharacterized protein [Fopius arisanus]|uniref:Uncharacterized protein n=1 Tax=Fopius arisanus TaxID=64838 RepID=A0A9R1T009_9HYME|nr:PREDICTED: uncharacterized protein LOC105264987 [Fopius arisanus]
MAIFWIILFFNVIMISVYGLTPDEIEAERSGWNADPQTQYHIQTDEGPERYFRYQTLNGQFRKEKRLEDGTVIGTEGWLDPLGYLRIKDYIADSNGYRILRSKTIFVGKDKPIGDAVAISRRIPAQTGVLVKPRRPPNPFRQTKLQEFSDNSIEGNVPKPNYRSNTQRTNPPITPDESYNELTKPLRNYQQPVYSKNYFPRSGPALEIEPPLNDYRNTPIASRSRTIAGVPAIGRQYRPGRLNPGKGRRNQIRDRSDSFQDSGPIYEEYPRYDGTHTVSDGFQYYLKRQYHEEQQKPGESIGSFGYVDPFGIRRVVYYKADGDNGFIHKKNNRYVGFAATPYDPSPINSSD